MSDFRFPHAILKSASSYQFTIGHGLNVRTKWGGWVIPDFQRDLVWTDEQKSRFIESLLLELPIGSYCYNESLGGRGQIAMSLLDGQQRWSAIFDFVDDKVPAFSLRYSELTSSELAFFDNRVFPAIVVRDMSYEEQKDIYDRLAYGGTPNAREQ